MPTRPSAPDPAGAPSAGAANPFATLGAGLGAGFDFFQDWLKAAGSALPNMPGAAPGMAAWTMPTLDPEELDKRIRDLKTVQFWLEQNARMIAMTIQGLEVQRMTLSTLKGMNVSMDALRESLKASAPAPTPTANVEPPPASTGPGPAAFAGKDAGTADAAAANAASGFPATPEGADLINPMRWWDTLTQQFTHLASQAAQAAQTVGDSVGESMDMIKQAQAQAANFATGQSAAGAGPDTEAQPPGGPDTKSGDKPGARRPAAKPPRGTPPGSA